MQTIVKAKKIGGSISVIIPKDIVNREKILKDDALSIKVEKVGNLDFLWGRYKDIKRSTDQIMKEIDENEDG